MDNLNELKVMPIWVCWNKVEKSGRMTKVPCSAASGKTGTNEEYRDTWVRYADAIAAAQKYMYSGVGFVIPESWFFLDIDHKELSDPLVQDILSRFDTYAEYSQSGAGLHLYAEREGIVYKCIDALMDVIRNGLCYSEPKCVLDARQDYLEDNSTVISFFHECMVPRKHKDNCTAGKLYDVYRAWCADNNNGYAETAKAFRDKLCEYLGKDYKELTVHTENGTCYRDYTLSLEAKQQYVRVYGYDNLS